MMGLGKFFFYFCGLWGVTEFSILGEFRYVCKLGFFFIERPNLVSLFLGVFIGIRLSAGLGWFNGDGRSLAVVGNW